MSAAAAFWLAPAMPLAAFVALALGLNRHGRLSALLASLALAGSTVVSGLALAGVARDSPIEVALPWLATAGRPFTLALWLDPLGAIMAFLVSAVALPIFAYAASYMATDPRQGRFFTLFSLFAASMLTLVMAADLLTLFIAWELVGLCSYFLIGFRFERPDAAAAATKAFLTTRAADLALLAGILTLVGAAGSSRIDTVLARAVAGGIEPGALLASALLMFAGAAGKSAQLPFHGWLPDAMAGPTPVSALLHSATMVAAGVFLLARLHPLFLAAPGVPQLIAWTGVATALVAGAAALVQEDLKRTLAYSTMSQLGLMFLALGSGNLLAGVLLLVAQALYKAPLFLAAGAIERAVGGTGFDRMGGLAARMPVTFAVFAIASAALAGLPVTFAIPPKEPALAAAWDASGALFAAGLLASAFTALYSARLMGLVFFGPPSQPAARAQEAPAGYLAPMLALVALLQVGLLADASLLGRPLERLLDAASPDATIIAIMAVAISIVVFGLGLAARKRWPRSVVWPPLDGVAGTLRGELGFVRLYEVMARAGCEAAKASGAWDRAVFDPLAARSVRIARALARRASGFDAGVFDALAAQATQRAIRLISAGGVFDLRRVGAAFDTLGSSLLAASLRLRELQTGRIENYLMAVFGWGSLLLAMVVAASFAR